MLSMGNICGVGLFVFFERNGLTGNFLEGFLNAY